VNCAQNRGGLVVGLLRLVKELTKKIFSKFGYLIVNENFLRSSIHFSYEPIDQNLRLSQAEIENLSLFRNDRYFYCNELRWRIFLQTGIPLHGLTIFEPGAGIGDQTQWLLNRGASKIIVSEGRIVNLSIIRKRFENDSRVTTLLGNLEDCLQLPEFKFEVDLIFMWGVYYHINDPIPDFPILKQLAQKANVVVFDYLESATGIDYIEIYEDDIQSASISQASGRPTRDSIVTGLRTAFGYAYFPIEQMEWHDPDAPNTPRRIIIGSKTPLIYSGLVEVKS
jgi:hypothetical protein